jgi:hypothetical protein
VFRCQWVKHLNGITDDNYGLTLVDLANVGYKYDTWVLTERVAQVFYIASILRILSFPETAMCFFTFIGSAM